MQVTTEIAITKTTWEGQTTGYIAERGGIRAYGATRKEATERLTEKEGKPTHGVYFFPENTIPRP